MTKWRRSLVGLLCLGFATSAWAERSAQEWLDYMSQAMRETNYTGTFVYRYGDQLESMHLAHRASDAGERERLVALNGQSREILRDGEEVTCIFPEHNAVVVDRRQVRNPLTDVVPSDRAKLDQRYDMTVLGEGRIADQDVVRIGIQPSDGYRFGYELAIARDSGLLLGSKLLADGGERVVEQILFTAIEQPDRIPDSALEKTIEGEGFSWHRREPAKSTANNETTESQWAVSGIPDGFELARRERHTLPGRDVMVEHWLYTDGLASVSLYIEDTGGEGNAFHGRSRVGALNVYGRSLGSYQVVVVGEVPAVTVESIGRSVKNRTEATP